MLNWSDWTGKKLEDWLDVGRLGCKLGDFDDNTICVLCHQALPTLD